MLPFYLRKSSLYGLQLLIVLSSTLPVLGQTIRYVSPTGTNPNPATATSWTAATADLQGAINASAANDQVWVKMGLYKPTNIADRTISFKMKDGVAIYGGFAGTETTLAGRVLTYPSSTTLSGDISIPGISVDNSYHVIYNNVNLTRLAILDGFVITNGNANGSDDHSSGGGIYNGGGGNNNYCSPTIRNCTFTNNLSSNGGAVFNNGSNGSISNPNFVNCFFQKNTSSGWGGAVFNYGPSGLSSPNFTNCSFIGNLADQGGALFNYGGILDTPGTSSPQLTNCSFQSNSAVLGGAMFSVCGSAGSSNPYLYNCIFWNNGGANTFRNDGATGSSAQFCLVEASVTGYGNGSNNLIAVVSPFANTTSTQLALPCSPAMDAGFNSAPGLSDATTDLIGNPRIYNNGIIDMGAYEVQAPLPTPTRLYVRASATGANTGLSWADAFTSLQVALAYRCSSQLTEIWVATGSYKPTTGTDRTASFTMRNGLKIYGGFTGTESSLTQRSLTFPSSTTLSGDIGTVGNTADNSYHVILNANGLTNTAILDGFVITGGTANGSNGNDIGGGILNDDNSSPTIRNCLLYNNLAESGGGMFNRYSSNPLLINCAFLGNSSSGNGGAMYNQYNSTPTITNCSFQGNSGNNGGALYNQDGSPMLTNCIFWNNGTPEPLHGDFTASYCLFDASGSGYAGNSGNLTTTVSPFVSSQSIQLVPCAPAISAGNPATTSATVGSTDLAGNPRFFSNGRIDMGAYEFQGECLPSRLYVRASATGANTGLNWTDAFTNLQSALSYPQSQNLTEIWVANGTYKPTTDNNRTIGFTMKNGVAIYGGFVGTETTLASRVLTNPLSTVLSGDIGTPNNNTDNSYHVIIQGGLNNSAILDGFLITGGNANGGGANNYGGGIYNDTSSPTISNCSFQGNRSGQYGGAMVNFNSSPLLVNCSFLTNTAQELGGAIFNQSNGNPVLTNCSFQGNIASQFGGAMTSFGNCHPVLRNCVLFGNGGSNTFFNTLFNDTSSDVTVNYSLLDNTVTGYTGSNNITVTASPFGSGASTQLAPCSPAIDAGDPATSSATGAPAAVGTTDLAGNPRFFNGGRIDMGAYEFPGPLNRIYVKASATGANTGGSWADAFTDLQSALSYACGQSVVDIWVATGVYKPTSGNDQAVSFEMKNGVSIYGGFNGTEISLNDRVLTFPSSSTLSGDIGVFNNANDNSYHVIKNPSGLTNTAILDGFVITGGNGQYLNSDIDYGGGIFNTNSSPVIRNCVFQNNVSASKGGAIHNQVNSNPLIINCIFQNNRSYFGGAISNVSSNPQLVNCSFLKNSSYGYGGAISIENSQFQITNCSFQGNDTDLNHGEAIYLENSVIQLTNCVLYNNGNSDPITRSFSTIRATYSLLYESALNGIITDGGNNILATQSPFVSTISTQLLCTSQAINAGLNSATGLNGITTDLAGNPRITSGTVDMGAYEYYLNVGTIAGPPIVPYPQEYPTSLSSVADASGFNSLYWQRSDNNGSSWTKLSNLTAQSIPLPTLVNSISLDPKTFQFRRVITDACSVTAATEPVSIKVFFADGKFTGRVVSSDGTTPVPSVTLTVVRTTTGLAGSPSSMTYTATSDTDGYTVAPIYYGVPLGTEPASVNESRFIITPRYADPSSPTLVHVFQPASQTISHSQFSLNPRPLADFKDLTTFAITGQTRQLCQDCITGTSGNAVLTGNVSCPVDSIGLKLVNIANPNQKYATTSKFLDLPAPADYGRIAFAVPSAGNYSLSVVEANKLVFVPPSRALNVTGDLTNIYLDSPTFQTIQGRVTAGCGDPIGAAELEFTDVLKDKDGNERPSCFKKRVTTNALGYYEITLPPRKYKVRAIKLENPIGTPSLISPDFVAFINTNLAALSPDSLIRDLTSATAVVPLNIVYQRPPTLLIAGLTTPPGCSTVSFAVMEQAIPTALTVTVWQGDPSKACPVGSRIISSTSLSGTTVTVSNSLVSGTVLLTTDIPGSSKTFYLPVAKGISSTTLLPGEPNIVGDFARTINVQYYDLFGREATALIRKAVVTGYKSGTATFTTSSPQIPILVLHDPPGDGSYSYWRENVTQEKAVRVSVARSNSTNIWTKAKLGAKFFSGIGIIVENETYGELKGGITMGGRTSSDEELIWTTKTSKQLETSRLPNFIGEVADVFVSSAINFFYSVSTAISYNSNSCSVVSEKKLAMAPYGTSTQFNYTESEIKDQIIKKQGIIDLPSSTTAEKLESSRQIKIWEQVLANNKQNKQNALFRENRSFSGGVGIGYEITDASSAVNTIEFGADIDKEVAGELGFEIAGAGVSGGVTVNFKLETGNSERNTSMTETTTGYWLEDSSPGDSYSVDIKTDPVYKTPLFKLLGGETSCPPEPETLPRDVVQLSAPITTLSNIPPEGTAEFILQLGNISEALDDPSRRFKFKNVNSNGAIVTIDGFPLQSIDIEDIPRGTQRQIIVRVKKESNSSIYAYRDLQFVVTDDCGGDPIASIDLSAFFQSPCSNVSLIRPEPNWTHTIADNNELPIRMSGYTLANLTNITLQYKETSSPDWNDGFTRTQAQLNNSVNGTDFPWNSTGLPDGDYSLRLKLTCPLGNGGIGTVYTQRADGRIDRTRPVPFGNTQPANDVYVQGSTIGITYNEPLRCSSITNSTVVARRVSNGQSVPVTVGCYLNQIVVMPTGSLAPYTGDVISLTLLGVSDLAGNVRTIPDSWAFQVGSSTVATGTSALSVAIANSPLSESATGTMRVVFRLPQNNKNVQVNFAVGGTAQFGVDYTVSFASPTTLVVGTMNEIEGNIVIPAGATSATLLIDPTNDSAFEPDETILISLLEGGDYQIGNPSSVTGVILNDDPVGGGNVIISIKTGNWEDPTTWDLNRIPRWNDEVIINQNHTVTLSSTGYAKKVTKRSNAKLKMATGTAPTRLKLGFPEI